MGPLLTHFSTFLFLFSVGIRRLLFSTSCHLQNPSQYRSNPWFFTQPRWKNLEFHALILALPLASLIDFISFCSSSEHQSAKFSFLQQSLVNFLFWVLLILILFREFSDTQIINQASTFFLAGVFFFVDYFLTGEGFMGVSKNVYDYLGQLTFICGCSCLYLSINPNAFFADFFLSIGLIFKATWVLQAGLTLYTDVFGLKGCSKAFVWPAEVLADVKCDLQEDWSRGIALMNLLFVVHAIGVFAFGFGALLLMSCRLRFDDFGGALLAEIDSETYLTKRFQAILRMEDNEKQTLLVSSDQKEEEDEVKPKRKRKVQWNDTNGKKLVEIMEFLPR
ncbi:hypothetical protein V2J09_013456 [Rumex salicifolius]